MITDVELKEIRWQGNSRKVAHQFPKGVRKALGKEITRIQLGLQPRNGDWLPTVGAGVQEIRVAYSKEAYRVIYVVTLRRLHLRAPRVPQEIEKGCRDAEGGARSRE